MNSSGETHISLSHRGRCTILRNRYTDLRDLLLLPKRAALIGYLGTSHISLRLEIMLLGVAMSRKGTMPFCDHGEG